MTRYFRPDSSEVSRRSSVAHRTYSGIDSISSPRNSVTRLIASTRTSIPPADARISANHSPCAASRGASARQPSTVAPIAAPRKTTLRASARSSTRSAPEMIVLSAFHCQMVRPSDAPMTPSVRSGTIVSRTKRGRSSPAIRTTSEPPSSARSGDSAAQSMCGALAATAATSVIGGPPPSRRCRAPRARSPPRGSSSGSTSRRA